MESADHSTRPDGTGDTDLQEEFATWPDITDYWPDAPHRIGPAPDVNEDPDATPTKFVLPPMPPPRRPPRLAEPVREPRPKRGPLVATGLALVVLLGAGGVLAQRLVSRSSTTPPSAALSVPPLTVTTPPPVAGSPGPAVVLPPPAASPASAAAPTGTTAPASATPSATQTTPAKLTAATFVLADDVTNLVLTTTKLDQGVARISVPDGSVAVPKASMTGSTVRLDVGTNGKEGSADVRVELDERIAWSIRFAGSAKAIRADMGDATTKGIEIDGGAAVVDLKLPKVEGTLPITMTGGLNAWRIRTTDQVDVRLVAKRGGGKTVLYGDVLSGVGKNRTVLDDADGDDRLDIDAEAGYGALTVERLS